LEDWTGNTNSDLTPVNMDLQTKYYDMDARGSNLSFMGLEFMIDTGGQIVTPYAYYDKGQTQEPLASFSTSGMQRVFRKLESTNSRLAQNISIRLNASSSTVNTDGTPNIILQSIKVFYEVRSGRARTGQTPQ
jgi:hypothetical protein